MTVPQSSALEFPAMLHGPLDTIRRAVRAMGQGWTREYLKTGGFTQPRRMLQVPPGEPLVMAVLRVIPVLVQANADLKHPEAYIPQVEMLISRNFDSHGQGARTSEK
jgi:hypothetical protein